ncbi:NB-ARC domain-containing protein [Herbihabitans rhizosphaerae]|uniref:NB-ARC domain-containing protein n=1 Tax=Herbihabitans rhizosphaerae TaxID=1872711 RepID=A0A4Q7KCZ0_9PSEU|nr:ATP-binding protein [Herbihabitans rhizosphaerae]RZS31195.1 NB-ARC domain-containing protein [Herbihabitans rhizosphaerae]
MGTVLPMKPWCVGRDEQTETVTGWQVDAVRERVPLLVLITGEPGAGKTTLTVAVAYALANDYPDGVLFCDCGGSAPGGATPVEDVASRLLAQLRENVPDDPRQRVDALRSHLGGRRILLVLDDVGDAHQVKELLGDMSRSAVLVTSRQRLPELENARFKSIMLGGLNDTAAEVIVTTLANPPLATVARPVITELNKICGGLPVALAMAAARLRDGDDSPEEFVEALRTGRVLDEVDIDGTLQKLFDAVYRGVNPDEARAYPLLALIPGRHFGFTEAAAALDLPDRAAKHLVRRLVHKLMVVDLGAERPEHRGLFRYHDLVREYATEVASTDLAEEVRDETVRRVIVARLLRLGALAKAYSKRPKPFGAEWAYDEADPSFDGDGVHAAEELDREWPNLIASARRAAELDQRRLVTAFPPALWPFAYQTGRCSVVIDLYIRALDYRDHEPEVTWQLRRDLAGLYERIGEHDLADESIALAFAVGYRKGDESLYTWRGLALESRGDLAEAQRAMDLAREAVPLMEDPEQERRALVLIDMHCARITWKRGVSEELDKAEQAAIRAHAGFVERGDEQVNEALCVELIARIRGDRGDVDAAIRLGEDARAMFLRGRLASRAINLLEWLAETADAAGRADDAARYRAEAEELRDGHDQ